MNNVLDGLISAIEEDERGEPANVTDGLFAAGRMIASAINRLGNADAATPMGTLEAHGLAVMEAGRAIADGLDMVAAAIECLADELKQARRHDDA